MQDVKIVDIDNVQWNMKDQEARDKIAKIGTIYRSGRAEITVTNPNELVREIKNVEPGTYILIYSFGYVLANNNAGLYVSGSTIELSTLPAVWTVPKTDWGNPMYTGIIKLNAKGDVQIRTFPYESGTTINFKEQANGGGLSLIKIAN